MARDEVAVRTDPSGEPVPSIAERIKRERKNIMRGGAIVYVCAAATATMYEDDDPEMMREALLAANDIFTSATQELERIAKAVEGVL